MRLQEQRGPIARTSKVGKDLEITVKDTSKSKGLEVGLDLKGEVACLILQEVIDPGLEEARGRQRRGVWDRGREKTGSKVTVPVVPDWLWG